MKPYFAPSQEAKSGPDRITTECGSGDVDRIHVDWLLFMMNSVNVTETFKSPMLGVETEEQMGKQCSCQSRNLHISDEHVRHWRRHGFTVVDRFLTQEELAEIRNELQIIFPCWEQYSAAPSVFRNYPGGGHARELPFLGRAANLLAIRPELLSFAERALGVHDILLTQSVVWAKYSGADDFEQDLHIDSNSIVYPSIRMDPEQITILVYYSDVDESLGPTYVIPSEYTENKPLIPYIRTRESDSELYKLELPILVASGSLLIYGMRIFHRASRLTKRQGTRLIHNITYRRADAHWVGYSPWANYAFTPELRSLLEEASPRQREVFGFPAPENVYWNAETVRGVAAQYPNMDMAPYITAAGIDEQIVRESRQSANEWPRHPSMDEDNGAPRLRQVLCDLRDSAAAVAAYYQGILTAFDATTRSLR